MSSCATTLLVVIELSSLRVTGGSWGQPGDVVKAPLKAPGINANAVGYGGMTALQRALQRGKHEAAKLLKEFKLNAELSRRQAQGKTTTSGESS